MIGVDGGAGKTARSQSATYWKQILGDVNFAFRTATGELVKPGKRLCVKVSMTGESTSEFEVSKRVGLLRRSFWVLLLSPLPFLGLNLFGLKAVGTESSCTPGGVARVICVRPFRRRVLLSLFSPSCVSSSGASCGSWQDSECLYRSTIHKHDMLGNENFTLI